MQGFTLAEQGHFVNALPPVDATGGKNSDVWSMREWAHATIIVQVGVSASTAPTLTLEACDNFTPSTTQAIPFKYWSEVDADGDTTATLASATTSGVVITTNNNVFLIAEVDARELPDGFSCMRAVLTSGAVSTIVSVGVILSGGRYAGNPVNVSSAIA